MSLTSRWRELTAEERSALEDQRNFLLRSLDDLEEEHAAGDVEDDDYEALRQDYTARAARVIRAIEAQRTRVAAASPRPARRKLIVVLAGVVLFAIGAGVLVAQSTGRRSEADQITGDIRTTTREELSLALELAAEGEYGEAIATYDEILDSQPDHVEARTYKGWVQVLSGDVSEGIVDLVEASRIEPDYPDAHAFLAVTFWQLSRADTDRADYFVDLASRSLDRLDALDPPPDIAELIAPLRAQIEGATEGTPQD
jgi:tetratricopeptide (TPR) repeat protein